MPISVIMGDFLSCVCGLISLIMRLDALGQYEFSEFIKQPEITLHIAEQVDDSFFNDYKQNVSLQFVFLDPITVFYFPFEAAPVLFTT